MTPVNSSLSIALAMVLLGGCAGQIEDPVVAGDEVVLDHVEALGFEREEASVLQDRVVVQGEPGYATVMGAASIESGCVYSPARVTQDDYATCAAVYPGQ